MDGVFRRDDDTFYKTNKTQRAGTKWNTSLPGEAPTERNSRGAQAMFSNGNRREACCAYSSCVYWHASERASFLTDSCDAATGLLKLSRSFRIGRILQRVVVKEERSSSDESLPPPSSLFLSLSRFHLVSAISGYVPSLRLFTGSRVTLIRY